MPVLVVSLIICGTIVLYVIISSIADHFHEFKELKKGKLHWKHEYDALHQDEIEQLNKKISLLEKENSDLKYLKINKQRIEEKYKSKDKDLSEEFELKNRELIDLYNTKKQDLVNRYNTFMKKEEGNLEVGRRRLMSSLLYGLQNQSDYVDAFLTERGYKALTEKIIFSDIQCKTRSESGNTYITSLTSCTCPDFQSRKGICKHMIALAIKVGMVNIKDVRKKEAEILKQSNVNILNYENELAKKEHELALLKNQISSARKSRDLSFPWLANQFAELESKEDRSVIFRMNVRAIKSRDIVSKFRKEKNEYLLKSKLLENTLLAYEYLFPWLEEFKTVSVKDALQYVSAASDSEEYESSLRKWLSPEEYSCLSDTQKNQLALERYQSRNKTDWEIGIEYERYIGYLYETNGYNVRYIGATEGVNDMGRDLIAEKDNAVYIIQCKRWSTEKQIHEKHIFQLFGTTYILNLDETKKRFIPVFYTTTHLSDVAEKCAAGLDIEVHQNFEYKDFPMIKCNIGKDENGNPTKIYHLPFDQQYDRVRIGALDGECYVSSVSEAEEKGFRRAYRWHGNN